MRIGINFQTYDEYISGVEYYTLGLLKGLLSIDQKNEYIVYTNHPSLLKTIETNKNLTIVSVAYLKTRIRRILWEHFSLPLLARENRLDILHCPHYILPIIKISIPYVVTIHDTYALDRPEWCKISNHLNYKLLMPRTSFKANEIISVSTQTRNAVLKYKLSTIPVVIHPGIDDCFKKQIDLNMQHVVRCKYKLPDKYLLYVGNVEPKKNMQTLVKAFQLLKRKGLEHKLVLVGKRSWLQEDVWDDIRNNIPREDVIQTGYVERLELPSVYQMADVFVFPSLSEGFGFPPLEAMRCGTAVVASSVGILKEMPSFTYCAVNPLNAMDIAEKIGNMIGESKTKRKQIKLALSESERFTWQRCAEKTLEIYRRATA